ncbi:hypothetical protein [uncultured Dokdonia sp.]|uniref:hypothetical protein n=1 Tax=uncultured Dokdonia sp. TaxID=575653 RepID=UPI0026207B82|nr:hypothetical protein [uncultured Dokdonia sp.]
MELKYLFSYLDKEISEGKLEILLHAYDLNITAFKEVEELLTEEQKEQFKQFEKTEEASMIRALRDKNLPPIDFSTLPEDLDSDMLDTLVLYSNYNHGRVWDVVSEFLTEYQRGHVTGRQYDNMDKKEEEKMAALSDKERQRYKDAEEYQKNNPTKFYGNIFEPENLQEYIDKYGKSPGGPKYEGNNNERK